MCYESELCMRTQSKFPCRNCETGDHDRCIALSKKADFDEPVKLCYCLFTGHKKLEGSLSDMRIILDYNTKKEKERESNEG